MLVDNEFEDVYSFNMYLINGFSDRFAFLNRTEIVQRYGMGLAFLRD